MYTPKVTTYRRPAQVTPHTGLLHGTNYSGPTTRDTIEVNPCRGHPTKNCLQGTPHVPTETHDVGPLFETNYSGPHK